MKSVKYFMGWWLERGKLYLLKKRMDRCHFNVPIDGIYLNYGSDFQYKTEELNHGGGIKIKHLIEHYPEYKSSFNLIYLVSSACPPMAEAWVRSAKDRGVKIIWNQDGVAYPGWAGGHWKYHNYRMRNIYKLADYVIFQSNFCKECSELFLGPIMSKWEILPNCVDLNKFTPCNEIYPEGPWVLLSAGTHQQPERIFTVLDTVTILLKRKHKVKLILAGKLDWPEAEKEVKEYAESQGIADLIIRIPTFTQDEAPKIYKKAHICIHPKYKDPCPTVVIEAMACGLPVIGSRSGGMPELVGDQGGILIDVPDSWDKLYYPVPEQIAEAVERICRELPKWRITAREQAKSHFSKDVWLKRHEEIFMKVLSEDGPIY